MTGTSIQNVVVEYLASLFDVSISSPTNGQALVYNSSTKKWANSSTTADSASSLNTPSSWQVKDDGSGSLGFYNPSNVLVDKLDVSGDFLPGVDVSSTIGSATLRYTSLNAGPTGFQTFHASADANASSQLGDGFVKLGVGGATTLDTQVLRSGAKQLSLYTTNAATTLTERLRITGNAAQGSATLQSFENMVFPSTGVQPSSLLNYIASDSSGNFFINAGVNGFIYLLAQGTTEAFVGGSSGVGMTTLYYYNGRPTAGMGASVVFAAVSGKGETGADTGLLTYTPPAVAGSYILHIVLNVSAASVATLGWTATWKDSNGGSQTPTHLALDTLGSATIGLTVAATAGTVYSAIVPLDIDNSATNIVIQTTFAGTSIAYKASAWITQGQ